MAEKKTLSAAEATDLCARRKYMRQAHIPRKKRPPLMTYESGVNRPKPCNGDKEDGVGRIEKADALDVLVERLSRKRKKFQTH